MWEFLSKRLGITPNAPVAYTKIATPLALDHCIRIVEILLDGKPKVLVGNWPAQFVEALSDVRLGYFKDPGPYEFPRVIAPVLGKELDSRRNGKAHFVRWAVIL